MSDKKRLDREEFADKVDKGVERGKNVAEKVANDFGKTMDDIVINLKSLQKDFDSKITEYRETAPSRIDLDLIDAGEVYYVKADLPGVEKDEVDVEIAGKELTITAFFGTECEGKEDKECHFLIKGRKSGPARRTITLPTKVKMDGTKAEFGNGVLFLELSKVKVQKLKVDIN